MTDNYQAKLDAFGNRIFSGRDLLAIMDDIGYGVGGTIHAVEMLDLELARPNTTFCQWDYLNGVVDAAEQELTERGVLGNDVPRAEVRGERTPFGTERYIIRKRRWRVGKWRATLERMGRHV